MKNKIDLIPLNIQLFAEPDPKQEMDDLLKEVSTEKKEEPKIEETKKEPLKTEEPKEEPKEESKEEDEEDEEDGLVGEDGKVKKPSIKELREAHKAEKKRAKTLEEEKNKVEQNSRTTEERLLKAIKLGIKGESKEDILKNLDDYEVKEEATKTGLTEEQVRKEADLKKQLENLTAEKQEIIFNKRAYSLQRELNIGDKELVKFIDTAAKIGINLLETPTDFKEIYKTIMGEQVNAATSEKDKEILVLKQEIARLKGEKAPEETPGGDKTPPSAEDWLKQIESMKG
jgi:hypothetical protein